MKHTIITATLSVALTLLICSSLLNLYQFSQMNVYSCMDGYTRQQRNDIQNLIEENAGFNLPKGKTK